MATAGRHPIVPLTGGQTTYSTHYGPIEAIESQMITGEAIRTKTDFEIVDGLKSRFAMILVPTRNLQRPPLPRGQHVQVLWFVESTALSRHLGKRIPPPECPNDRTSILYPSAHVSTDITQWIPADEVLSEAFVFYPVDIDNGYAAFVVGMENSICVYMKWKFRSMNINLIPRETPSPFRSLNSDSFSKRKFEFLQSVTNQFQRALCKIGTYPRNSVTIRLRCSSGDWSYIKKRLSGRVEAFIKEDSKFTRVVPRGYGARESIKSEIALEFIRVDTDNKLSIIEKVLGKSIRVGVRMVPVHSKPLRKRDGGSISVTKVALVTDKVYGFFDLGDEGLDVRPKLRCTQRGFDLVYNSVSTELALCLRFKEGAVRDRIVQRALDIERNRQRRAQQNRNRTGDASPPVNISNTSHDDSSVETNESEDEDDSAEEDGAQELLDIGVQFQEGCNMFTITTLPHASMQGIVECRVTESDVAVLYHDDAPDPLFKAYSSVDGSRVIFRRIRVKPSNALDIRGPDDSNGHPSVGDLVYFKTDLATSLIREYHLA